MPATITVAPVPTRTTARFVETNGIGAIEGVFVLVGVNAEVVVLVGVNDVEAEFEGVPEQEPAKIGAIEKGAGVTPRKTVFAGAVARTVAMSLSVLYKYSFIAEVRYN